MPKAQAIQTVDFKGHDIPEWDGDHKNLLIPTLEADIWYPPEHTKAIATAIKENIACLLIGETGTGKTSMLREVAYLRKQPYYRINLTGYTSPDELIGSKSAQAGSTYFEEGVMIKAMREGALLVMDEINATPPDCLFALHSLLDDERKVTLPTGTVVYPHPEFRFFATMNPDYEGTKSVNKALTDRFGIILDIKPLEPDLEKDYLKKKGVPDNDTEIMVMFATKARKAYQERQTTMFVSTRTLLQWGQLISKGLTLEEAFVVSVLNKLPHDPDMRRGINDAFYSVIKKNPKTNQTEFGIYSKDMVTQLEDSVRRMKEEVKQREGQWVVQRADLVQKMQKVATLLKQEREKNSQMNSLMPQLKKLMNQTPDIEEGLPQEEIDLINESIEEVEEAQVLQPESDFAGTQLDIRKK
jgi:MoxR-like ATPase